MERNGRSDRAYYRALVKAGRTSAEAMQELARDRSERAREARAKQEKLLAAAVGAGAESDPRGRGIRGRGIISLKEYHYEYVVPSRGGAPTGTAYQYGHVNLPEFHHLRAYCEYLYGGGREHWATKQAVFRDYIPDAVWKGEYSCHDDFMYKLRDLFRYWEQKVTWIRKDMLPPPVPANHEKVRCAADEAPASSLSSSSAPAPAPAPAAPAPAAPAPAAPAPAPAPAPPCGLLDPLDSVVGRRLSYAHAAMSDRACWFAHAFLPQSGDVFICTAPKTGTTLLQQMCQQLTSVGKDDDSCMAFDDIYQVSPFLDLAFDLGQDSPGFLESLPSPRVFKSHQRLSAIPRCRGRAKYICVVRDPERTALSWFNFLVRRGAPAAVAHGNVDSFIRDDEWFARGMRYGASIWEYFAEYYLAKDMSNVLVLCFEDLVNDLAAHVVLIAEFIGMPVWTLNPVRIDTIVRRCSKEFMLAHISKFDESWTHGELSRLGRSPRPDAFKPSPRVVQSSGERGGVFATATALSDSSRAWLQTQWEAIVTPLTGCQDYAAMVDAVRASQGPLKAVIEMEQKLADYDSDKSDDDGDGDDEGLMLSTVEYVVDSGCDSVKLILKEDLFGTLASSASGASSLSCWSGGHVWDSSRVLADFLSESVAIGDDLGMMLVECADVLELGSGCGLLGLAAMALGGRVTMTDQALQLPLLKMNAERNFQRLRDDAEAEEYSSICPCLVKELTWGSAPGPPDTRSAPSTHAASRRRRAGFDLVLGSDLFYIRGQAASFTATLLSIFHTARAFGQQTPPVVLLAHGTRADSFHQSFFEAFEKAELLVETVSVVNHDKVHPEKHVNHHNPEEQDAVERNVTTIFRISLPSYETLSGGTRIYPNRLCKPPPEGL